MTKNDFIAKYDNLFKGEQKKRQFQFDVKSMLAEEKFKWVVDQQEKEAEDRKKLLMGFAYRKDNLC